MEPLNERELLFCAYYSRTHSAREAAARAGYRRKPELNGIRLLEKDSVRMEIERLEQKLQTAQDGALHFYEALEKSAQVLRTEAFSDAE